MIFDPVFAFVGAFLNYTWWFWLFLILWPLFRSTWRFWREELWVHAEQETGKLFEIKMPREVLKSPQAMEQVLEAIHKLGNAAGNLEEWWIDGEVTKWFSLELVSIGGEIHFYLYAPKYKQYDLVKASFYAFYRDIELVEVEDYLDRLPVSLREMGVQGLDLYGTELVLTKEDAYPTKTYKDFESPDENKQYDPIATAIEMMSGIKPEQFFGIQIVIAPILADWGHHYAHVVESLKVSQSGGGGHGGGHGGGGGIGPLSFPGGPLPANPEHHDEPKPSFSFMMRTPGETTILEAVEGNLSKPAFETVIRFMYVSPQPTFWDSFPRRGIKSIFNQYSSNDLNGFALNDKMATNTKVWDAPYVFPQKRQEYRKARLLHLYRHRLLPPETFMGKLLTSYFWNWNFNSRPFHMTSQCLATIFHPPTVDVMVGPHVQRANSKKAGPPAGLEIFADESTLERFNQQ